MNGLYVAPPHGELSFSGVKTALAKARPRDLGGVPRILCSGQLAYGEVTLGKPEEIDVGEFDSRFQEHRVTKSERKRWWPEAEKLYLFPFEDWKPFESPRGVSVPPRVQTIMGEVKWADGQEGQEMSEKPQYEFHFHNEVPPAAALAGSTVEVDELEKARDEEQEAGGPGEKDGEEIAEGAKPWTVANPPAVAKDYDAAQTKACVAAANATLKDGKGDKEAIQACIGAAKQAAKKALKTEDLRGEDEKDLSLDEIRNAAYDAFETRAQPVQEEASYISRLKIYAGYVQFERGDTFYKVPYKVKKKDNAIEWGEPVELVLKPKGEKALEDDDLLHPDREAFKSYSDEFGIEAWDDYWHGHDEPQSPYTFVQSLLVEDEKVALTSQARGALPDSAFAWIGKGPGCEKKDGKTPAKCRHLPIHDCAHAKAAAAALSGARTGKPMTGVPASARAKIKAAVAKCVKKKEKSWRENLTDALASFADNLRGSPPEVVLLDAETGIKTFKHAETGETLLLTWTMNAFKDREDEIFTTESIEQYVEKAWDTIQAEGSKGRFDFWHIPGSEFGDIKFAGTVGRFLLEFGTFDDGPIGQGARKLFEENPDGHPDIAPEGWATSHRYKYLKADREDKIYEWFDKDRTTVLPRSLAANPWNPSVEVIPMLSEEQKSALVIAFGEDLAQQLIDKGESETKKLEEEDVAHKSTADAKKDKGDDTDGATTEVKGLDVKELAEALAEHFQFENLDAQLKGMGEAIEQVQTDISSQGKRLDATEKSDVERLAEKEKHSPRFGWMIPSRDEGNVLKEGDALKGKKPETPAAIQGIMDNMHRGG